MSQEINEVDREAIEILERKSSLMKLNNNDSFKSVQEFKEITENRLCSLKSIVKKNKKKQYVF
jgi:hypothetical protein